MKFLLFCTGLIFFACNVNAQTSSTVEIDKRAYNYYTKSEIEAMPDVKKAKINYLINNSFIIPNEMKGRFSKKDINGLEFSAFRQRNKRVSIPVQINKEIKSKDYIVLLSETEIKEAYRLIEKKYQK